MNAAESTVARSVGKEPLPGERRVADQACVHGLSPA
jgi:hypothetical protein